MPILMSVQGKSLFSLPPDEQMEWTRKLIKAIDGPVRGMGSGPPAGYTTADMAEAGYAFLMYAATALGVGANAVAALFREMKEKGTDEGFIAANPGPYHDPLTLMRVAHLDDYVEIEKRYTASM